MKLDFLIIYEVIQRELDSILLIGAELEKRGYLVDYVKFPFQNVDDLRRKYFNNVDVILTQSMYNRNVMFNLVYNIAGKVKKVVNLQWEQVRNRYMEYNINDHMYPKKIAKEVLHLCWGETPRKNLIKAGVSPNKAIVTGPIHMDFLREEFNHYYRNKDTIFNEFGLDVNRPIILFISSFSYAGLPKSSLKDLSNIIGKSYVNTFREISLESQKIFLEWVKRFLNEYPLITFIYRPHPAEYKNEVLNNLEETWDNFKVINIYSVKEWIKITDKLLTWYSTSIAEAYYSNKNCVIIRPIKIPDELEVSIMTNSKKITSYEEFLDSIKNECKMAIDEDILRKYYDVDKDLPSYIRICNLLEEVINTSKYNIQYTKEDLIFFKIKLIKERFMNFILSNYISIIRKLTKVQDKYGLRFGNIINKRIKTHKIYAEQKIANEKQAQGISETKEKLRKIVYGSQYKY